MFLTTLFITSSFVSRRMLKFVFLSLILTFSVPVALSKNEAIEPLLQRLDSKRAPPSVQEAAARGVLKRLLPTHLSSFEFKIVSKVFFLFLSDLSLLDSIIWLTLFSGYPFIMFNWIFGFTLLQKKEKWNMGNFGKFDINCEQI